MTEETPRMTSHRPYLLRALSEWIADNDMTPHLLVDATQPGVQVPPSTVKEGKVVFEFEPRAARPAAKKAAAKKAVVPKPAKAAQPAKPSKPSPAPQVTPEAKILARIQKGFIKMGSKAPQKVKPFLRHVGALLGKGSTAEQVDAMVAKLEAAGSVWFIGDEVVYGRK